MSILQSTYYSMVKGNVTLTHAAKYKNIKIIMLSERSQSKKEDMLYDYIYTKL